MFNAFKEIDKKVESFQTYVKRVEQDFALHNKKYGKKVAVLLSCMGSKLYNLLCNLNVPKDCETLKYSEIVNILLKHLSPESYSLSFVK